jgi:hypothetical protein
MGETVGVAAMALGNGDNRSGSKPVASDAAAKGFEWYLKKKIGGQAGERMGGLPRMDFGVLKNLFSRQLEQLSKSKNRWVAVSSPHTVRVFFRRIAAELEMQDRKKRHEARLRDREGGREGGRGGARASSLASDGDDGHGVLTARGGSRPRGGGATTAAAEEFSMSFEVFSKVCRQHLHMNNIHVLDMRALFDWLDIDGDGELA